MPKAQRKLLLKYSRTAPVALGTLAANTALLVLSPTLPAQKSRLAAIDFYMHTKGLTAGEGGRLAWGIADGSMSVGEITEALVADPTSQTEVPAAERARRPVRLLGHIGDEGQPATGTVLTSSGHRKINMSFDDASAWAFFVWNYDDTALTTGVGLGLVVKHYIIPVG